MPVTYQIDARPPQIIHTTCSGDVTLEEVLGHFRTLRQDPACPDRLHVLLDLSDTSSLPDAGQIRTVSDTIGDIRDVVQFQLCAVVVRRDALFGMARMFAVFAEQYFRAVQVFRTTDDAEQWLLRQISAAS